jgi:sugar/nucleoside kinase (ribokinase family)
MTTAERYLLVGGLSIDTLTSADGTTHLGVVGGNALFAAAGAHLWSSALAVAGVVGRDYPREWLRRLRRSGIDVRGVQRVPEEHEGYWAARYLSTGEREPHVPEEAYREAGMALPTPLRRMAAALSGGGGWRAATAARDASWRAVPERLPRGLSAPRALLLLANERSRQRSWIEWARAQPRAAHCPILLDPEEESGLDLTEGDLRELLGGVNAVMPSARQISGLLATRGTRGAALALAGYGPSVVAIKRGAAGSYVFDSRRRVGYHIPAYAARVVDPTGAGDAYCGGFTVGLIETGSVALAGLFGAVAASFTLEGYGALHALSVDREDAVERLEGLLPGVRRDEWTDQVVGRPRRLGHIHESS